MVKSSVYAQKKKRKKRKKKGNYTTLPLPLNRFVVHYFIPLSRQLFFPSSLKKIIKLLVNSMEKNNLTIKKVKGLICEVNYSFQN